MFDFSEFCGGNSVRQIEFLGLSQDQTRVLLEQEYGLSKTLMEHYPDVTKRAGSPTSIMKAFIIFENAGRDCYYSDIASALNISEDTAYQHMAKVRKWISSAFGINIEHAGERIYMVTNQTIAQKAELLEKQLKKAERPLENLLSDVNSIRQSGQTPVLSGKASAMLAGYEQVKQLEAANN